MKLIEDVGFDQCFSFIYSRRPGTPAADLPDDTPDAVKHARLKRLQAAHQRQCQRRSRRRWSAACSACWSRRPARRDAGEFTGRTENMRYVNFAGHPRLIGQFVDVLITEVMANSLRGRVLTLDEVAA